MKEIKVKIIKKQGGCIYGGGVYYVVKYKFRLPFYRYLTHDVDEPMGGCVSEPRTFSTADQAKREMMEYAEFLKACGTPKSCNTHLEYTIQ